MHNATKCLSELFESALKNADKWKDWTNPNLPIAVVRQGRQVANALKKGKLFERTTLEGRFGLTSLFDNPVWRALWEQAKENKRNTGQENAFTRYEDGMRGEIPNRRNRSSYEREAFSLLEKEFRKLAREQGIEVPEGQIHHNNWPIERYSDNATDPKNLYPTEPRTPIENQHRDIHRATSEGPHPYNNPVSPTHEKPLYENRPVPMDDNDLD